MAEQLRLATGRMQLQLRLLFLISTAVWGEGSYVSGVTVMKVTAQQCFTVTKSQNPGIQCLPYPQLLRKVTLFIVVLKTKLNK